MKKSIVKRGLLFTVITSIALTSLSAFAQQPNLEAMRAKLVAKYPKTTFGPLEATPVTGIYQVLLGKNIAYVDESGRYFFFGGLYDMVTQHDLAGDARERLTRIDLSKLNKQDAIKHVVGNGGNGKRDLYVFTDPDCPYCKKLEGVISQATNLTIWYFPFPLVELHAGSKAISQSIWCSEKPEFSWLSYMHTGARPTSTKANCDSSAIERNLKVGQSLGITGTPTMISGDGRMRAGYLELTEFNAWLDGKK